MGHAKCRGTYAQRKATPKGQPPAELKRILFTTMIPISYVKHEGQTIQVHPKPTDEVPSRDGRTHYSYDGKMLRRKSGGD